MPITRYGPTPTFLRYATQHVLIPTAAAAPPDLLEHMEADALWLEVPSYQRGISWTVDQVEELLWSGSVLLGNAVLGKFPRAQGNFPHLHECASVYATLVDGLQRFSVATALLALLFPRVLRAGPEKPELATFFARLKTQSHGREVIYLHNDRQLLEHPRRAVADAYASFRESLGAWLDHELLKQDGAASLSRRVTRLFLDRQIAVDVYSDFAAPIELTFTFIGMNTVRVDLSPVDLMRAAIVERAIAAGWLANDLERVENRLAEVFTDGAQPERSLLPFVNVVNATLNEGKGASLIPSWNGALSMDEVDAFLDYVEEIDSYAENPYVNEIRECGAIPYAGLLAYYYAQFREQKMMPGFIGSSRDDNALRSFLKATYRLVLDGRIGRTRGYAELALLQPFTSLTAYADRLSVECIGRATDAEVDRNWLRERLRQADKGKARRIFNAMRLPLQGGDPFRPDEYGRQAKCLHVDHLIPQKTAIKDDAGYSYVETLLNFAPLLSSYNVVAKATPCAEKLAPNGIYEKGNAALSLPHPYATWLVDNQGAHGQILDQQHRLEPNHTPDIPDERLTWMVDFLLPRI